MTAQQAKFAAEYLVDLNGKQAAIRAGYSPKTAAAQASRLLTHVNVRVAIEDGRARKLAEAQAQLEAELGETHITAVRVLVELGRLATVDTRGFFDEAGNLKPVHQLTAAQGAALAGFEVIKKNAAAGDGVIDTVHKIKLWDKPRSLEMLAKHFALLVEKVEHSGEMTFKWQDQAE